jgi:hypothetical protein
VSGVAWVEDFFAVADAENNIKLMQEMETNFENSFSRTIRTSVITCHESFLWVLICFLTLGFGGPSLHEFRSIL